MTRTISVMGAAVSLALGVAIRAGADVAPELKGLWITSSAAVDTSSPQAMVDGLIKPGMTDEQKVLAIFHWYRRVIFPHNYLADDRREILRQINSYGNTLCGSHAANLGWLLRTAGFKTHCVYISGGGHTFVEVWYDDAWHAVDPETDFAVWSRGDKRHLISMAELKSDPTLLDNAEAEGRAKPWLFKAMKFPWTTRKQMAAFCENPTNKCGKMEMQWSSSVLKGMTIKEYFVEGVKTVGYSADNEPNGGHIIDPDLMKIALRPGETLVRRWGNEGRGKYIRGEGFAGYPAHLLYGGGADESDEEVFRYVEPYRRDNYIIPEMPVDRCYRYSGNGHLVWGPDITAAELATAAGVRLENLVYDGKTGMIRPVEAGKTGTLTIPVRSSYALVGAAIRAGWHRAGTNDAARLGLKEPKGGFRSVWDADRTGDWEADATIGAEINRKYNYELQFQMTAAGDPSAVGLRRLTLDHTFVNNWLALPFLAPGENTIRVRLDNPEMLRAADLQVQVDWEEGENWREARTEKRRVTASPFEFKITAKGPKFPRMKEITLAVTARK